MASNVARAAGTLPRPAVHPGGSQALSAGPPAPDGPAGRRRKSRSGSFRTLSLQAPCPRHLPRSDGQRALAVLAPLVQPRGSQRAQSTGHGVPSWPWSAARSDRRAWTPAPQRRRGGSGHLQPDSAQDSSGCRAAPPRRRPLRLHTDLQRAAEATSHRKDIVPWRGQRSLRLAGWVPLGGTCWEGRLAPR